MVGGNVLQDLSEEVKRVWEDAEVSLEIGVDGFSVVRDRAVLTHDNSLQRDRIAHDILREVFECRFIAAGNDTFAVYGKRLS